MTQIPPDHIHVDVWTESDQHRFEDGIRNELRDMRTEVRNIGNRLLLLMGALALIAFTLPLVAPLFRSMILGV